MIIIIDMVLIITISHQIKEVQENSASLSKGDKDHDDENNHNYQHFHDIPGVDYHVGHDNHADNNFHIKQAF